MAQEAQPEERHRGAPSPFFLLRWGKRARAIGALGAFLSNPANLVIPTIVGLVVLSLFMLLFATGATFPPGAGPVISPSPGGDIATCKFVRGDQNPPSAPLKSRLLAGFFLEAERINGVPTSLLASVARIENPSFFANADDNHDALHDRNFTDLTTCAPHFTRSPTGALGLMQIQPPGTTGYFAPGVELGASYLNKSVGEINFCNVRESVIVASGFILKKLQLGYGLGDGTKWDPQWANDRGIINKVAESYYGCLGYPSCQTGPYNYSDDLWQSLQNCRQIPLPGVASDCPVPGGKIKRHSFQVDPVNGHCSPSYGGYCAFCGTDSRRAKAIDVIADDRDVLLSTLQGQQVQWKLIQKNYVIDKLDGGGYGQTFETTLGQDKWYLDMLHLTQTLLESGREYPSGTIVGKSDLDLDYVPGPRHIHMTIGKNLKGSVAPGTKETDCDEGWMPTDPICR